MKYFTTVTSKGQLTLPANIRRQLNIRSGQKVQVSIKGDTAIVEPLVNISKLRQQTHKQLQQNGFTPKKLQEMAKDYQNGDGFEAHLKDAYGQS